MTDAPLVGNGVDLLADAVHGAQRPRLELAGYLLGEGERGRKDAQAAAAEGIEQGAVLEFADDFRAQAGVFQPAVDAAAQRVVAGGQQHRRAIQAERETGAVALGQIGRGKEAGGEIAEPAAEHLEVAADRRRTVGQHDVEAV